MAVPFPGIHVFASKKEDVDARHKAGHGVRDGLAVPPWNPIPQCALLRAVGSLDHLARRGMHMSLGLILVIILIIFLLGGFSGRFGGYGYGMGHSGMGLGGLILVVLLVLLLLGKL
jgi:hypothetical protein